MHLRLRFQNLGKPRTAGLCGRTAGACDCGPLSCAFIERPSPLRKPSCKVRLFAQNRSRNYRQKVTATTPSQTVFHRIFQLLPQMAHVCFRRRKWVHTRLSEKDRTQRLTRRNRGIPSLDHSAALCCQRNPFYSTVLLYTYISRFSVNPQHQQKRKIRQSCRRNAVPNRFSSHFSASRTNGPRSLSRVKAGTHSAFGEGSHRAAYTPKQGAFRTGVVSLPSERSTRFGNPAWPGLKTANFAAFGAWPGVLQKNAESLRDSDALMRVAVPRRRGPAGLRDLFSSV